MEQYEMTAGQLSISKNNSIVFHSLLINRIIESLNGKFEINDYNNGNSCRIILPKISQ